MCEIILSYYASNELQRLRVERLEIKVYKAVVSRVENFIFNLIFLEETTTVVTVFVKKLQYRPWLHGSIG